METDNGKNGTKLYVFDKETNELRDKWSEDALVSQVLKLKLGDRALRDDPAYELARESEDRFIFLTRQEAEDILKTALTVRNPIIDNVSFQRKYKFDEKPVDKKNLDFRMELLKEEYDETVEAYKNGDAEEFVDGLVDLVVIALGTLHLSGVSANEAWSEVFRANMTKVRGVKPGREQSGGFDVYKPEGWVAPDHSKNHGDLDELFRETKS